MYKDQGQDEGDKPRPTVEP